MKSILIRALICIGLLANTGLCFKSVPVILASHLLVKGLKTTRSYEEVHTAEEVLNLAKQMITECTADEYLLIDIPGLELEDLRITESENWPFLRQYLKSSSSIVGCSRVEDTLDYAYLEKYIIKTCHAETINVVNEDENEVAEYLDIRKKVINIKFADLPEVRDERINKIRKIDDVIRKIIRKLPSPHYSIILSSSKLRSYHYTPEEIIAAMPTRFQIFSDIFYQDPSRELEYERNNIYRQVEPDFRAPRHTNERYLRNKKKDEIHFFDYDLWKKNETIILTVISMIFGLVFLKLSQLVRFVTTKIFAKRQRGPHIIGHESKMKTT